MPSWCLVAGAFDFYRCGCRPGQQNWVRPLKVVIIQKKLQLDHEKRKQMQKFQTCNSDGREVKWEEQSFAFKSSYSFWIKSLLLGFNILFLSKKLLKKAFIFFIYQKPSNSLRRELKLCFVLLMMRVAQVDGVTGVATGLAVDPATLATDTLVGLGAHTTPVFLFQQVRHLSAYHADAKYQIKIKTIVQ